MRSIQTMLAAVIFVLLSSGCEKALELKTPASDPKSVYYDLWEAMDQKYALFDIKNIDWDSMYQATAMTIEPGISNEELFKKCSQLLEVLKDGHVSLSGNNRVYVYENFFRSYPVNFNLGNIIANYLQSQYVKLGPIIYKVVNEVAYMHYGSFREDITDEALDIFFQQIAGAKGLIIDVRSNNGGNLSNARKIYSRLISEQQLVKYEQFKRGPAKNDFYDREAYFIIPSGSQYKKPVVVLTNRSCFSACNDFVLYMSLLPGVTIVGDQTGGGGAVPANYVLLNGWVLQYSSSITFSPAGEPIENGINPDIQISILPIEETRGSDPIVEKAYELLK